ncbi:tRNA 2-selenouridine(34) synthase MnmH [Janthinobacterium sp. B9-8]|uniref:tRNA 2-selenouridine(34) synthase MnmH n=1 Tax=Janthinobacterium sp. B9-8 TaxID=1236179 RepID=UPI0007646549|nr:tRNA 2-selenouridine(34) synthase MnmH [Janthinobacterium sp. B9-8]AMC33329.1 tRNA 2-selenouridine synthase [Janthinobacterium sp. B9-8]
MKNLLATLADLSTFDEVIDVRTPLEFADDHIPGAINAPVLSNEERVIVGTLYKQDPFAATKLGAGLVAKNLGIHLATTFKDKPKNWKPLIYCWRGGKRSGSMTTWFNLIGWKARQLQGGYKTYRGDILVKLDAIPAVSRFIVLAGHTGCGKTRLLNALERTGAQTLDLEGLAKHRGSVLGASPAAPQPSQKSFDSQLIHQLSQFDPSRPVFVEAESKRIGLVHLPASLMLAIRAADCILVQASFEDRIRFLCDDYANLFDDPLSFKTKLSRLVEMHGKVVLAQWNELIDQGKKAELFGELISKHYDPAYKRSSQSNYLRLSDARPLVIDPSSDLSECARQLILDLGA